MVKATISVEDLRREQQYAEKVTRDLGGNPMVRAIRDATLMVQRDARILSPVDTGRLRASITPTIKTEARTVMGIVGTNVEYAPYVELGTRFMRARRFMAGALERNVDRIMKRIERGVNDILRGK